jgi:hypothetical protein
MVNCHWELAAMFWKPLLIIAPAGLMLGTIGGQLAKPVMLDRVGDDPVQAMFQSRADRLGHSGAYPAQPDGPMSYNGGYSYAPDLTDATQGWTPPDYYHFADVPLPTVAQLDARQAALLADPEVQFASRPSDADSALDAQALNEPQPEPDATTSSAGTEQVAFAPEPRTDDGALPAIW